MPQKSREYSQSAASTDRQTDNLLSQTAPSPRTWLGNNKQFRASACEYLTTPKLQFLFTATVTELNLNLI
jgi:hypothetical protein